MVDSSTSSTMSSTTESSYHPLYDKWTLWAHLPHDTDWTVVSYKKICTFTYIEEVIGVFNSIPDTLTKNCMLFIMREGIQPIWEDPKNRTGGCFSYKIINKQVPIAWKNLAYALMGETLTNDKKYRPFINGITISPKKNFCIMKVWTSTCKSQNPELINNIKGLSNHGCLFKKHLPD